MKSSLLLLFVAALSLSQTPVQLLTPDVKRVGEKLACKCGSCVNTVGSCPMIECHYAHPAREKIAELQKGGQSDEVIVASFVKEGGLAALSAPPAEGFNLLGWVMPFIALTCGALFVIWHVKRNRRKPAVAEVPQIDQEALARYRDRIDKDLAKLE